MRSATDWKRSLRPASAAVMALFVTTPASGTLLVMSLKTSLQSAVDFGAALILEITVSAVGAGP